MWSEKERRTMPNHVMNVIHASAEIIEQLKNEDGAVDFNTVVPTPSDVFQGSLSYASDGWEIPEGYSANWYDWSVSHWGTKWNAYDVVEVSDEQITFDTAWAHPAPVIEALVHQVAESTDTEMFLKVIYADEDRGRNLGAYRVDISPKTGDDLHIVWSEYFREQEEDDDFLNDCASRVRYGISYEEMLREDIENSKSLLSGPEEEDDDAIRAEIAKYESYLASISAENIERSKRICAEFSL